MGLTRGTKINFALAFIVFSYTAGHTQGRTIKPLSWSQIKNNYFLSLILNQARARGRAACSEKTAPIIPPQ